MRTAPGPEGLGAVAAKVSKQTGEGGRLSLQTVLTLRKDFQGLFFLPLETQGVAGGPSGGRRAGSPTPIARPWLCKTGR